MSQNHIEKPSTARAHSSDSENTRTPCASSKCTTFRIERVPSAHWLRSSIAAASGGSPRKSGTFGARKLKCAANAEFNSTAIVAAARTEERCPAVIVDSERKLAPA